MKKCFFLCMLFMCSKILTAQTVQFPVIKNGGGIFDVPSALPIANLEKQYKIVSEITDGATKPDSLNPTLEKMARLYNLHRHAGIDAKNLKLAVIIHFTATPIILSDEAYKKKFGIVNPNTQLINELAQNGVKFYVCGQSITKRQLVNEPRNPNIQPILAAMLGLSSFQLDGYVFMP